ncbi:androgen-dependent TFPI-regulating protein-like isoform X2 [Athalia rosae]|uniref:androgen-dependent TFPI-regulating protein-like isoform X2 n=1 Tax=Athalia rosae TaxID=37344 RepID=UPI00203386F2|nr:androgen-dependent TFPI-regulating protein-like isoform X2 [Athalia rosae]
MLDSKWMQTIFTPVHAIFLGTYSFTIYYACVELNLPPRVPKPDFDPGQLKYLTFWNLILQAVFFFVCLANDFGGSNELSPTKRPFLRRFKDFFHASLAFPVAMFVGVTFWALMAVDRELVLPRAVDPYFPWWLNHLMHTMIVVSTIAEMFTAPRQYPSRLAGLGGLLVFMAIYLIWVLIIYTKGGIWVYPVMEVLSWPLRICFFLVLFLFAAALYIFGEYFDRLIWGQTRKSAGKSGKKRKSK